MSDILFHREDYPFAILEEFGLTAQMILDLPESVHLRLQRGAFSPLLPIKIEQPNGYTRCYAKFCLIETDEGVNLLFSPKLEQLDLNQFSEEEKQLLLSGKAIVADIMESNENDAASSQRIKVFVQIDPDTNNVVYTPSQIIGRNLSSIGQEFNLSEEVLESFWKGKTASIESDIFVEDQPVELTIGIDLFSKTGVMVVYGNAVAIQCWDSLEQNYGCAACVTMSMLSEKLIPAACEVDIAGAVSMYALTLASGRPSALLDWNNNFAEDRDKCVCTHCGNFPKSFVMNDLKLGTLGVLGRTLGKVHTFGAVYGKVKQGDFTFFRISTDDTKGCIKSYLGKGDLTDDPYGMDGCIAVTKVDNLQPLMKYICKNGFEHHVYGAQNETYIED